KNLLLITINLSTYFLQIIFIMMVGHIEKFALSSTAIATSLCVVSGFSVIFEMSCALKILGGQIYGARQYRRFCVLVYTYCYCSFESSLCSSLSFMDMLGKNNDFVWSRIKIL
ncbi:hypothetical protein HN873_067936, partial [Arachis hypogaea]